MRRPKPRTVRAGRLPGTKEMLVEGWTQPLIYDESDAEFIESSAWCLTNGYPSRRRKGRIEYLHVLLLPVGKGKEVDHENRNKMDARRCNLRALTHKQNTQNLPLSSRNRSGYRGVSQCARSGRWKANVRFADRQRFLGRFDTPEQAAEAAQSFRKKVMKGATS